MAAADPQMNRATYHEHTFPCRLGPVQGLAALFAVVAALFGCGRSSSLSVGRCGRVGRRGFEHALEGSNYFLTEGKPRGQ